MDSSGDNGGALVLTGWACAGADVASPNNKAASKAANHFILFIICETRQIRVVIRVIFGT